MRKTIDRKHPQYASRLHGYVCTLLFVTLMGWLPVQAIPLSTSIQVSHDSLPHTFVIEWPSDAPKGSIHVSCGTLGGIRIVTGKGRTKGENFYPSTQGTFRIEVSLRQLCFGAPKEIPMVLVKTANQSFSFFLRDVHKHTPIFIPAYHVVVLHPDDPRGYATIAKDLSHKNLHTSLEAWQQQPEESYQAAAAHTLAQQAPTILGLSRDFRIFHLDERVTGNATYSIKPAFSDHPLAFPDLNMNYVAYAFAFGRGLGTTPNTTRSLEDGVYPIRHTQMTDGGITYHATAFVGLEKSSLNAGPIRGTNYLVAAKYSSGSMLTEKQQAVFDAIQEEEMLPSEETILYYQVKATNTQAVPKYAWFKTAKPGTAWWVSSPYTYDAQTGFSSYTNDRVFAVSQQDGTPMATEEMAVLLQPGETTVFEFYLPHEPISAARAEQLAHRDFDELKEQCKQYWQHKLEKAALIHVPEKRINEMIQAGLLHLDLITYGREPDSTLAPAIGKYSPIGTESSPIIQFYASMGWLDIAKRSVNYFLDKQHENGFIQNFNGYMVETGAALYTMGEYFRYANDTTWLRNRKEALLKSCNYLIKWRDDNKLDALRGEGYGMISGKVADPEDHFHQYMLNGYGYLGLQRIAEIMKVIAPKEGERLGQEAAAWKKDIRTSFFNSLAMSPVLPLNDGTWVSSAPPWTGKRGLRAFNTEGANFWSHGTFTTADALLGPLYLVFCEVLDPEEPATQWMLNYHADVLFQHNTALSQPYYSRHDWIMAKLGLVKPFLKTYYNAFSGLADRDTYTFWEHVFEASPHKTHEEAWFLMQTRWMLYLENGTDQLDLLKTIPRDWLRDGDEIILDGVESYFGTLQIKVQSKINSGSIHATIDGAFTSVPGTVTIRIPHPDHKKPTSISGGIYDEKTETVTINHFNGSAAVQLRY